MSASALRSLERIHREYGSGMADRKLGALRQVNRTRLATVGQLRQLHEILCFLRAYPDSPALIEQVTAMLGRFAIRSDLRRFSARLGAIVPPHTGAAMNLRVRQSSRLVISIALAIGCSSGRDSSPDDGAAVSVEELGQQQVSTAPAVRRVWSFPEEPWEIRPSPDGRFFAYLGPATNNIVLHDMSLGTERLVTSARDYSYAEGPGSMVFSPDGQFLAYSWQSAETARWEVRIAGLGGQDSGKVRSTFIASLPDRTGFTGHSWTPDGAEVIATLWRWQSVEKGDVIVAISRTGGGIRKLRTVSPLGTQRIAVSPDGRWIAYETRSADAARHVRMMDMNGGSDHLVTTGLEDIALIGWSGTDGRLLVASERGGTPAVWSVAMVNGKAIGAPVLVRSHMWGMTPLGTSRSGRVFYSVLSGKRELYTVPIDPATGAIASRGIAIQEADQVAFNVPMGWSADGEYFAYSLLRPDPVATEAAEDVVIRSHSRGTIRRLSSLFFRIWRIAWLRDGRALLVTGIDNAGAHAIFRVDLENASLTLLARLEPRGLWPGLALSLGDDRVLVISTERDSNGEATGVLINVIDAISGKVTVLRRIEGAQYADALSLSPDGVTLALLVSNFQDRTSGRVVVAPIGDGPARVVYQASASERLGAGIAWSPDGRHLILGVVRPAANKLSEVRRWLHARDEVTELRRLSLEQGTVTSTGFKQSGLVRFEISPDGRTLLYGLDRVATELWTMDPPVLRPARSPGDSR